MLWESIKMIITTDSYYLMLGGAVVVIAFYKSNQKLMDIINKLMQSEQKK